jgi:two-component system nitrate/nitrite response regulator NarL
VLPSALIGSQTDQARANAELAERKRFPVAIGQFGRLVSLGLWAVLSEDRGLHIVGNDFDYLELRQLVVEPRAPSVIILDAARAGADVLKGLREAAPSVGLLLLIQGHSRTLTARLLEEGATECLSIETAPDDIRAAARRTAICGDMTPAAASQQGPRVIASQAVEQLTPRERDVLELLIAAQSRTVIALTLHVTEATVDTHVKNIYRKLGVKRRDELFGITLPPR